MAGCRQVAGHWGVRIHAGRSDTLAADMKNPNNQSGKSKAKPDLQGRLQGRNAGGRGRRLAALPPRQEPAR